MLIPVCVYTVYNICVNVQQRTAPEPPPEDESNERPPHIPPRPDATRKVRSIASWLVVTYMHIYK